MVINRIKKGIRATSVFVYDNEPITIRPLRSVEFDDAKYKSLELVDDRLAGFILKLRLKQIDNVDLGKIPVPLMKNYIKYMLEFDYYVVFYSMRDFYPDLTLDTVREMHSIHQIANKIIGLSTADKLIVEDTINTSDGQELVTAIYIFHQPLESALYDLTPLQHNFLTLTDPRRPKKVANTFDEMMEILPRLVGD